eukprot:11118907-Alexandrium_andersonii.AAC.1
MRGFRNGLIFSSLQGLVRGESASFWCAESGCDDETGRRARWRRSSGGVRGDGDPRGRRI